jgi:hypothetical protein
MTDHLSDIRSGLVSRTNVIGLRKALNAEARRYQRLSVSSTAPKISGEALAACEHARAEFRPRVSQDLHDSGLKLLRSPRYRKRLAPVADIIAGIESFHLVSYDALGRYGDYHVPVYKAVSPAGSFLFRNIPWQSGGDGPEILKVTR